MSILYDSKLVSPVATNGFYDIDIDIDFMIFIKYVIYNNLIDSIYLLYIIQKRTLISFN